MSMQQESWDEGLQENIKQGAHLAASAHVVQFSNKP